LFGERFKLARDEAAMRGQHDPWLLVIPCRFGHLFPWGSNRLAVSTDGRGSTAQRLAALPFVRVEQDGADGLTLSFGIEHFEAIAAIVRPHRRAGRQSMPADERQRAVRRLEPFRFTGRRTENRRPKFERNGAGILGGSEHVPAA
jgi:hypothetical protein